MLSVAGGEAEELATGLDAPKGVAFGPDGTCYIAESGAGRIVKLARGGTETVLDGLGRPEGIVVDTDTLWIVDAQARKVIAYGLASGQQKTIASGLPVGIPAGIEPKYLGPIPGMAGPIGLFADITMAPDGTLYISADAEGCVMALRPQASTIRWR